MKTFPFVVGSFCAFIVLPHQPNTIHTVWSAAIRWVIWRPSVFPQLSSWRLYLGRESLKGCCYVQPVFTLRSPGPGKVLSYHGDAASFYREPLWWHKRLNIPQSYNYPTLEYTPLVTDGAKPTYLSFTQQFSHWLPVSIGSNWFSWVLSYWKINLKHQSGKEMEPNHLSTDTFYW